MQSRLRHTFSSAFFLASVVFLMCATVAQGAVVDVRRIVVDVGKREATRSNKDPGVEDVAGWFREYVHSKSKRGSEITEPADDMALGWFRAAKLSERNLKMGENVWSRFAVPPLSERETVKSDLSASGQDGTGLVERGPETDVIPPVDHAWFSSVDLAGSEEN